MIEQELQLPQSILDLSPYEFMYKSTNDKIYPINENTLLIVNKDKPYVSDGVSLDEYKKDSGINLGVKLVGNAGPIPLKNTALIIREGYSSKLYLYNPKNVIYTWHDVLEDYEYAEELKQLLLSHQNDDYITNRTKELISIREKNKTRIQKKYNDLKTAYTELGYKTDLATLAELDDLLYCEAETFMDKIYERIDKKNNAKNLKLSKFLANLNNKPVNTCTD